MLNTYRRAALIGAITAGAALMPTVASATPASGVTGVIISQVTVAGKDYILRQITVQPGGSTGWHYHDGTLYAVVEQGTLTHTESDCVTTATYSEGAAFVEDSGAGNVHIGRNLGTTPVVLDVLYVDPAGSPLSESVPNPGCGFQ
ncbi:cupin domain-containing protein [Actinospica sp.]|jgi:quercetin dioxygenase-like cupin family protein|uniref:cupin domain-containing protein n=1 Tax=Actinospica sp. TaxID=1872142 RepID=UPI002D13FBA5|nr:cupin domain-containing protein [Actinospica sp.]HWG27434.1 cupin domain-containing protein [Actinospica sp.]